MREKWGEKMRKFYYYPREMFDSFLKKNTKNEQMLLTLPEFDGSGDEQGTL